MGSDIDISLPLGVPQTADLADGVEYAYIDHHEAWPFVQLRHFHRDRSGNLFCELTAGCMTPGLMTPISGIRFNLSSLQTRKGIVQGLDRASTGEGIIPPDWQAIINDVCWRGLKFYRNGHEVENIWPIEDKIPDPAYLLYPILPLHQPGIIFGDGGTGKGHIAITLGILAQLPYEDNGLGLTTLKEQVNCLYCDYESDSLDFQRTLSGLCRGFDINIGLKRLSMSAPVADSIEQLANRVKADNIGFIILDSLGPAAGGNINDSEPAIRLFTALRQLENVTTLIVAHNSKDPLSKTKSVFGSVFFTNLARSVWEVKKSQDTNSPEMIVSLVHKKYNRQRQLPIGLKYTFGEDGVITVVKCDLATTPLSTVLPLRTQIKALLRGGSMTVDELAEETELSEASIRTTLNRYKNLFVKVGDGWGLLEE